MTQALTVSPVNTKPTIRISGQRYAVVDELLQSMMLHEATGGLASLELTLIDWVSRPRAAPEFAFSDSAILKLGAEIKAYGGDVQSPQELFRGRISAIESEASADGPPLITVLAEDRLQSARKARRSEIHEQSAPDAIIRKIAQRFGLTPVIGGGLDQPVCDWAQLNESDLAFLRRVLDLVDGDIQVVGGELQASLCARRPRGRVDLRLHDNLLSLRVTADLADQTREQRVAGWDAEAGASASFKATDGGLGPGSGRTGASFIEAALEPGRGEAAGHFGVMPQAEAEITAKALFSKRARRFVRAKGLAEGTTALRTGAWVTLSRVNPMFEGEYCVVEARHSFDQLTGYTTAFTAESAYFGGAT
jgi:uncharacterized protein